MNYGAIKKTDIANGPGVRVSLFVSGCTHHCKECFNPETWDFDYGKEFTPDTEDEILEALRPGFIRGFTGLGGEPFEPENQRAIIGLVRRIRKELPLKDIWFYTGYLFDRDLTKGGRAYTEVTDELLSMVDVIVDGEFQIDKKVAGLLFCGSSNQRLIHVSESLRLHRVITVNNIISQNL
ncbi:MAG: anaerobic ribonucleoside-triphosphate reductase activating protein [Lachnospiraceae bacterium]|nr:anaerobic ribonucleoside-triphosphate reductase activating protein [Lachnospiraceae bacterium]